MTLTLTTVAYLIVAIAMTVLILMQRGSGAGAGAGFGGGGGSASVFGARGASNFLSKSTKWLAIVFFVLSLGMAMYVSRVGQPGVEVDLGVMGSVPAAAPEDAGRGDVPAAPEAAPPEVDIPLPPQPAPVPDEGPRG